MRDVEEGVRLVAFQHPLVDRAGDDVARRELAVGMNFAQELLPVGVGDSSALAPKRLGQEEAAPGVQERGRVELDVLEVQQARPRAPRHREAVAAGAGRVRRVQVDLAEASGREDRLARQAGRDGAAVLALEQVRADDDRGVIPVGRIDRVVGERQQIDRRRLEEPPDVLLAAAGLDERPLDRGAGLVLDVENARNRVRSLERPVEARAFAVEGNLRAPRREASGRGRAPPARSARRPPASRCRRRRARCRRRASRACRRGAARRCRPARRGCSTRGPRPRA